MLKMRSLVPVKRSLGIWDLQFSLKQYFHKIWETSYDWYISYIFFNITKNAPIAARSITCRWCERHFRKTETDCQ